MSVSYNIQQVDPTNFNSEEYNQKDVNLITNQEISEVFNPAQDVIEAHVYTPDYILISSNYNTRNFSIEDTKVILYPEKDAFPSDEDSGLYYISYNFLQNRVGSADSPLYISQISPSRTEIRLTGLAEAELATQTTKFIEDRSAENYTIDFYLNLGDDNLRLATNITLDGSSVLLKLYEPLPNTFDLKNQGWIAEKVANTVAYSAESIISFPNQNQLRYLKGPNTALINSQQGASTTYQTATTLQTSNTGSLSYQLNNILNKKGVTLNIDYNNFANFVHFSSAETRLENFYYKLTQIENYQVSASISNLSPSSTTTVTYYENQIKQIVTEFDDYEMFLYFQSGSNCWPKLNSQPPFQNVPTTYPQAITWLQNQLIVAQAYDNSNNDFLVNAIPEYLREDQANAPFELFVEMVGQHFDTVYTYYNGISQDTRADNRLDYGISKNVVADTLRDFGIKLYQSNFTTNDLYTSLLGMQLNGSLTFPTGSEVINTYVTASATSSLFPIGDLDKQLYKRIHYNLPYLLKKKGTVEGLRGLITTFGIPDTILRINEFGGKDKTNVDDWDNWQNQYNYEFTTLGNAFVSTSWHAFNNGASPNTVEFRFKTTGSYTNYSQSLLTFSGSTSYGIVLEYTGSGLTSASYSGSIIDPYYQYGTLKWISGSVSASVFQPFFNGDWWSVGLTADGVNHTLYAKQKGTYTGDNYIKYEASTSFANSNRLTVAPIPSSSYLGGSGSITLRSKVYNPFSGSFQELRYYTVGISQSVFDDFVMNPYSIESNQITASQQTLLFRAPLGTDLKIYSASAILTSTHPSVTGSNVTQSFDNSFSTYVISGAVDFNSNTEYIYQDQPNAGIRIAISDKVKITNNINASGSVLSQYRSIQQNPAISQSYTRDVNYIEIGLSPQDEINDDIQEQLGFFNFGDYIGDPRQVSQSNYTYPNLDQLRDTYFSKYSSPYNLTDFIRVVKYFNTSLFRMIEDFIPARAGVATGIIIKQHILERNRYRTPQTYWENNIYTGSVSTLSTGYDTGSVIYTFDGGTGGSFPTLTTITGSELESTISQSWQETIISLQGPATITHDNLEEFYNGELSGSVIQVSQQSLISEDCEQFLDVDVTEVQYKPILYLYSGSAPVNQATFLSANVIPSAGEILLYYISEQVEEGSPDSQLTSQRPNQIQSTE